MSLMKSARHIRDFRVEGEGALNNVHQERKR